MFLLTIYLLIIIKIYRSEIMQTDFVPSISVIMGLPIPSGNTGKLIPKILQNLNINEILYAYNYNTQQLNKNYNSRKGLMNKGIFYCSR